MATDGKSHVEAKVSLRLQRDYDKARGALDTPSSQSLWGGSRYAGPAKRAVKLGGSVRRAEV